MLAMGSDTGQTWLPVPGRRRRAACSPPTGASYSSSSPKDGRDSMAGIPPTRLWLPPHTHSHGWLPRTRLACLLGVKDVDREQPKVPLQPGDVVAAAVDHLPQAAGPTALGTCKGRLLWAPGGYSLGPVAHAMEVKWQLLQHSSSLLAASPSSQPLPPHTPQPHAPCR